jgi:signal transduction histidine kinase
MEVRFGVACQVHSAQSVLPVSKAASFQLYRVVQEAITNAIRHGKARRIDIDLTTDNAGLRLCVKDDGCGFSPAIRHSGMGLRIMEHRAHTLGGALRIDSFQDRGTAVHCLVPLAGTTATSPAGPPRQQWSAP